MENEHEKDFRQLKDVLSFIETTDLEYVQIEREGKKFTFRRSADAIAARGASSSEEELSSEPPEPPAQAIKSPIVGIFFNALGPDRPPLVVEGGRVTAGQKVAVVEAMKIKKEVFSPYAGKVTRILVRDNDPVEYGQELFLVETENN